MRRVLFVDDEPRILRGIENLLFAAWETWEVVTADSGAAALEILSQDPCDLVVTDMRMPGMDGLELLTRIRAEYPQAITCVLSGHAEAESVLKAMLMTHRYMAKPTNAEQLLDLLGQVDAILESTTTARSLLAGGNAIPPRPKVLSTVKNLLAEGASFEDVGAEIETDAVITARILKVANSVFFRGRSPVETVATAISRMGSQTLEAVLAQAVITESFGNVDLERMELIHQRLVAVGGLAKQISAGEEWSDRAHLAGMLHDVGRLILLTHDDDYPALGSFDGPAAMLAYERERYGTDHARVAGHLLTLWGFNLNVIEAVTGHHDLEDAIAAGPGVWLATATASAIIDEQHDPNLAAHHDTILGPVYGAHRLEAWRDQYNASKGAA